MENTEKSKNMELGEFVSTVLSDLVNAVEEASTKSIRDIHLSQRQDSRTVEFDIAVTAENTLSGGGKAGIKVINFFEINGGAEGAVRNSTVSRVQFGVTIDTSTKAQNIKFENEVNSRNNANDSDLM